MTVCVQCFWYPGSSGWKYGMGCLRQVDKKASSGFWCLWFVCDYRIFDGPQNLFWRIPHTGSLPKIVASSNLKILPQICTTENALFIHKRYSVGELKVYCHLKFNPIEAESVMVHNAQNLQVRFGSSNADTFKVPYTKTYGGWKTDDGPSDIYLALKLG